MARDLHSGRNTALKALVAKQSTTGDTQMLEMKTLREHPDNEYLFGMEGIDRLVKGIQDNGFKGAIEVWDMGDGTRLIYSGARRYRANKILGNDMIKAFVYPYPASETVRRRQLLGANIYGRNAIQNGDPIHTARQITYLRETIRMEREEGTYDGEKTREELAKEFGTSPSNIYKYESLLKLSERAQEAVMKGELQLGQGSSMSVLSEEKQDILLEAIALMRDKDLLNTRNDVQALVDFMKANGEDDFTAEALVNIFAGNISDKFRRRKEEKQSAAGAESASSEFDTVKLYSSKAAVKKFGQCYDKMEEFFSARKKYKKEDREMVLERLQKLKTLIDAEINSMR